MSNIENLFTSEISPYSYDTLFSRVMKEVGVMGFSSLYTLVSLTDNAICVSCELRINTDNSTITRTSLGIKDRTETNNQLQNTLQFAKENAFVNACKDMGIGLKESFLHGTTNSTVINNTPTLIEPSSTNNGISIYEVKTVGTLTPISSKANSYAIDCTDVATNEKYRLCLWGNKMNIASFSSSFERLKECTSSGASALLKVEATKNSYNGYDQLHVNSFV